MKRMKRMRKLSAVLLALMLAACTVSLALAENESAAEAEVPAEAEKATEEDLLLLEEGWIVPESTEMTPELEAEFAAALEGLLGVNYTPIALLAEKDGTKCFLAQTLVVYPGATPGYALVYLREGEIQNIWQLYIGRHAEK